MKKIILIASIIALGMASCKKDYTCECTFSDSSPSMPQDTRVTETVINGKKKDAKVTCESGSSIDGFYKVECVIK